MESLRRVVLGIGGNLGAREAHLAMVPRLLEATPGIRVLAHSARYVTAPVGPDQPDFLNAALLVETPLSLPEVLERAHFAEACLDRRRLEPWGPRTMDVDILCSVMRGASGRFAWERFSQARGPHTRQMEVPHAQLLDRAFALVPMADVAEQMKPSADFPILSAPKGQRVVRLSEPEVRHGEGELVVGPGEPLSVVDAAFSALVPAARWSIGASSGADRALPSSGWHTPRGPMPSVHRLAFVGGTAEAEPEAVVWLRTLIAGVQNARKAGRRAVGWSLASAAVRKPDATSATADSARPCLWALADATPPTGDLLDRVREVRACVAETDMDASAPRAHGVTSVTLRISQ